MASCRRFLTSLVLASAASHVRAHALTGVDVYESVSSKVSTLGAQLAEMELANKQAMAKKKAEYENAVVEATKKNTAIDAANVELEKEIEALNKAVVEKRKKAEDLRNDIAKLEADFSDLDSNFSTSLEFADATMKSLERGMDDKSIKLLDEIVKREEDARVKEERLYRLNRVAGAGRGNALRSLAMLQTHGAENTHPFLTALNGDLQELNDQRKHELNALMESYADSFKGLKSEHDALLKKHKELAAEKGRLTVLERRLQQAVHFLEKVNDTMESKARSLRMFAARIGIRPVPRTHRLPVDVPPAGAASD